MNESIHALRDDINNSLHDLIVEHCSFITVLIPIHKLTDSLVFKMHIKGHFSSIRSVSDSLERYKRGRLT